MARLQIAMVRPAEWAHKSVEEASADGSAASFFAAALGWAQGVHAEIPSLFVSVILAQWAEEQGYRWPPMYNNPGNVGDPVSAGQKGYSSIGAGVAAYASTMRLGYYVNVRAQRTQTSQCYALGQSPYAAGKYDGAGPPPGEDLVKIIANFDLTQYDGAAPAPSPTPSPTPTPTSPNQEKKNMLTLVPPMPGAAPTGGSWALAPDGGVDTADGSQIYGSLAGNRFGWDANGNTLDGITAWWDGTGWGYKIAVLLGNGAKAPDGGVFDYYRFPSNGSLLHVAAARFEETPEYEDHELYLAAKAA